MTFNNSLFIFLISFFVLAGCQSGSDDKKSPPAAPPPAAVDPVKAFEEFEMALRQQVTPCKSTLEVIYEGESFKDYAIKLECPVATSVADYDRQIPQLEKVAALAKKANEAPEQTRTRKNMSRVVYDAYTSRAEQLKIWKESHLKSLAGYKETLANLKKICVEKTYEFVCPEEASFAEFSKNYKTYENYINSANSVLSYTDIEGIGYFDKYDFDKKRLQVTSSLNSKFQKNLEALRANFETFKKNSVTRCQSEKVKVETWFSSDNNFRNVEFSAAIETSVIALADLLELKRDLFCDRFSNLSSLLIKNDSPKSSYSLNSGSTLPTVTIVGGQVYEFVLAFFQSLPESSILKAVNDFFAKNNRKITCIDSIVKADSCIAAILKISDRVADFNLADDERLFFSSTNSFDFSEQYKYKHYFINPNLTADEMIQFVSATREKNKKP